MAVQAVSQLKGKAVTMRHPGRNRDSICCRHAAIIAVMSTKLFFRVRALLPFYFDATPSRQPETCLIVNQGVIK